MEQLAALLSALCPYSPDGIAAGEKESRKASIGCQICGDFFVGWSKGDTPLCVAETGGFGAVDCLPSTKGDGVCHLCRCGDCPHCPGERPLHGTAGRAGGRPLPLFPNGIAAGEKRDNRKVLRRLPGLRGLLCGRSKGEYLFLRGGGEEGPGLRAEAKTAFSAAFADEEIVPLPSEKLLRGTVGRAAGLPSAPIPKRDRRRGKREITEKVPVGYQACGGFFVG